MKFILTLIFFGLSFSLSAKMKVITTTTNLADIVRQVGGEFVEVQSLCKGTQDPHFLEAKPSYTFKLAKADLLVSIGAGLEEGWLPLVIRGSRNPDMREGQSAHVVASSSLNLLEQVVGEITRFDGDVHPEGNPHFMLGPSYALKVAEAVTKKLVELDQVNKLEYEKRMKTFEQRMTNSLKRWKKILKEGTKVITYHKTMTYFYKEFGLQNIDVLEPKPGIPPTASHILKIISTVKEQKISKIVVENYFDETVAKRVKLEVPEVEVVVVPVAVDGRKDVNDIFALYDYLVTKIGG